MDMKPMCCSPPPAQPVRLRGRVTILLLALIVVLSLSGCSFLAWFDGATAVAQTSGMTYPIVDTNQSKTYDATSVIAAPSEGEPFFGQDAQVDGNQPSYVDNGDGTVTDLVTGLMWTQDYYGKTTYAEASASADSFELAGYDDWRLPTVKELYSLIDFSGEDVNPTGRTAGNPFIDTDVFAFAYGDTSAGERIIDSQWATSTLYTGSTEFAGGAQLMFGVNFADGRIKGYPVGSSIGPDGQEKTYFVRYVRGNASYGINSFVSNGDRTVSDLATGLMWAQDDSRVGMTWEEALAYVQELNAQNYLGYSDWTLPNAKEMQSIVDYDRSPGSTNSAAIDPVFNATAITNEAEQTDWGFYWTSTTHANPRGGEYAVYVAFGRGLGYVNGQFMDVHGAGCQRSDPKTGSASYGNAPQGDVVRVTNLVRVVRVTDRAATGYAQQATSDNGSTGYDSSSNPSLGSSETPDSTVLDIDDGVEHASASKQNKDYILFAPLNGTTAYLINRDGDVVHDWTLSGRPGNSVYLLAGGDLLATYTVSGSFQQGGVGGGVQRLRWDGAEMWSFELATEHAQLHHDVEPLPNGNVLLISWEAKTRQEALAAGLSASQLPRSGEVWSEMILEYDPDQDTVVWAWHLWDHILPEGQAPVQHPEKIDLAAYANPRSEDWWHLNAVDYNETLDQIVVSSRAGSEFWILDHDVTTAEAAGEAGDLLYRFGNPETYGGSGDQVLYGQHDVEWLDGNSSGVASSSFGTSPSVRILVFDNGDPRERPYSRVVELELPDFASSPTGVFPEPMIVWEYPSEEHGDAVFFADHISGAQRLNSGNTLICVGTEGRFFEVAPSGQVVWEYVNPFTGIGPGGSESNEVFRCESYSAAVTGLN